jgi:hypothetical protein
VHSGGTEVRDASESYTGDTYCLGCGAKLQTGAAIEPPPASSSMDPDPETGAPEGDPGAGASEGDPGAPASEPGAEG